MVQNASFEDKQGMNSGTAKDFYPSPGSGHHMLFSAGARILSTVGDDCPYLNTEVDRADK